MKIYFDTRKPKADGTYPLKIVITRAGQSFYIPLGIYLKKEQWKNGKVTAHPRKNEYNTYITKMMMNYENAIIEMRLERLYMKLSTSEVKKALMQKVEPRRDLSMLFMEAFEKSIGNVRESSKRQFNTSLYSLKEFCNIDTLRVEDIDKDFAEKYIQFMKDKGLKAITINNRYFIVSKVLNWCVANGKLNSNPISSMFLKNEKTLSRALTLDQLRMIAKSETMASRIFMLSFYLQAMNPADMFVARVQNGKIEYKRQKTGHSIIVRVEPEAMRIIDDLTDGETILGKYYSSVHTLSHGVANALRKEFDFANSEHKISLYWARHTWATIASMIDIPRDTIASALGHTWADVTSIYIDSQNFKMWEANRKVIDFVLYEK